MKTVGRTAALVNGAGTAVGRALAGLLLDEGHRLCVTDPDALALRTTLRTADRRRVVALVGAPDDVDHQHDAVEQTLGAFGRIDVLINVVGAGTQPSVAGWIRKVDLAWTGERGGTAITVFQPPLTRDGAWPVPTVVRLSRVTARLQDELGPRTRLISILAPPALLTAAGQRGPVTAQRSPVMPLRSPATVVELVGYLLSRRASGLAGRTLLAQRAGVPWSCVDAPLPAAHSPARALSAVGSQWKEAR